MGNLHSSQVDGDCLQVFGLLSPLSEVSLIRLVGGTRYINEGPCEHLQFFPVDFVMNRLLAVLSTLETCDSFYSKAQISVDLYHYSITLHANDDSTRDDLYAMQVQHSI